MTAHTFSDGKRTWRVEDLWAAAKGLTPVWVELADLEAEKLLDSHVWTRSGDWTKALTVREVLDHARRVADADLDYPIILTPEGRIADGTHRIARALQKGWQSILAIRLRTMPEPIAHELPL